MINLMLIATHETIVSRPVALVIRPSVSYVPRVDEVDIGCQESAPRWRNKCENEQPVRLVVPSHACLFFLVEFPIRWFFFSVPFAVLIQKWRRYCHFVLLPFVLFASRIVVG